MQMTSSRLCGSSPTDLAEYLRQVRPIALLTRAQERELGLRLRRDGCERAREQLICANLRLVVYAAKRYAGLGVPMQDLVEAGNVGLIQAVGRFDPDHGARFSTYAIWWIKRAISNSLAEHGSLIRVPRGRRRIERTRRLVERRLAGALGRPATDEEVARAAGLSLTEVRSALRSPTIVAGEDGALCLGGVDDRSSPRPDQTVGGKEVTERLRGCLRALPGAEAEVVRLRFGLGGRAALTIAEIARELGMTRTGVTRLLDSSLDRLEVRMGRPLESSRRARRAPMAAAG